MTNASQLTGPIIVAAQGIYEESSTAQHKIGGYIETADGRGFRYAKMGGVAGVPGKLYQASAEDTTNYQNLTVTAPTAGDLSITTTSTLTVGLNDLAGGFLVITTATTNAGQFLRIKGNTAATAAAATIYLDDPVLYTPTGTTKIDMHLNPYMSVVVNPTTATSTPVGACVFKTTIAYYGWLQTHGPCALLADGAITVGTDLVASNGTAGAVEPLTGVQASIGKAITGIATTEYGLVLLTID